jgi:hypothetical protein
VGFCPSILGRPSSNLGTREAEGGIFYILHEGIYCYERT